MALAGAGAPEVWKILVWAPSARNESSFANPRLRLRKFWRPRGESRRADLSRDCFDLSRDCFDLSSENVDRNSSFAG